MYTYLRKYRERKYLMRIMISINLLIVSFMLISLLAAYISSRQISLGSQREANEKVLSQINYNISYMNDTVKNFAISLFYDNDMAHLLFSSEEDKFEDTDRINKLNKTIAYNSFVHSIIFYNSKRDRYFVSGENAVTDPDSNFMNMMEGYLAGERPIFKMQLMPVAYVPDANHPERTQQVFSLFLYDSLEDYNKSESALIVNIKPEWLFEKLELMNLQSRSRSSQLFILDQNKEIYSPSMEEVSGLVKLKEEVNRRTTSTPSEVAQFTYTEQKRTQIVNYMVNTSINWVIVDVEPYSVVLGAIEKLKFVFITVAAVSLFLALLASLFVSNRLYSPISGLLKQTRRLSVSDPERLEEKDEIGYIAHIYNDLIERLETEQSRQEGNESIVRSYYLRKLITDSPEFTDEEWRECRDKGYVSVNLEGKSIVGVLKIDNYGQVKERASARELRLLHFAISNIAMETVSKEFPVNVIDIRGEHLVLLFGFEALRDDTYARIGKLLREAQAMVDRYYHVTFTVALSDVVPAYSELTFHYEQALDYLQYRLNFGRNAVIVPEMVRENVRSPDSQIPPELERKLIEGIKANRQDEVFRELDQIRGIIAGMSTDGVIQSVIHLGIIIKRTIREINDNKLSPVSVDLRSMDRLVFEHETLDDIFAAFGSMLEALFLDRKQGGESKADVFVDTIKDVVQANYSNPNLSLQEISDMLKMSPAYVGRIFKKHETVSVADYINEIRLLKSVMLLENNTMLVHEISEKVGFSSQSYFFKLFKKRFGTTPKDYRIKKSLNL